MRRLEYILFLLIVTALGVALYLREHPGVVRFGARPALAMTVFDVGQGDAIFLETADGAQMLVDGGPDDTTLSKLGEHMPYGDRTLDWVVLTHPHADHVAGLISVLERYTVRQLLMTGARHATPQYLTFLDAVRDHGIPVTLIEEPKSFSLGGALIATQYPLQSLDDEYFDNPNDASVVLLAGISGQRFLLMGDLEEVGERELIKAGVELRADVLKVGHHGSRTSSSEALLDAVRPRYALISAGQNNQYGHPHREVVRRLGDHGATVLRTDELGDLAVHVDEEGLCVFAGSAILECK